MSSPNITTAATTTTTTTTTAAEPTGLTSKTSKRRNPPFSQVQQCQIIAALFRGESHKSVIESHRVSDRQLRRITQNLRTHGTFHAPSTKKMGRPSCLNMEVEQDLKLYVAAQPLALLADMQKHVHEKHGVKCSRASLSRRVRELGYTRVIVRRDLSDGAPNEQYQGLISQLSAIDAVGTIGHDEVVEEEDDDAAAETDEDTTKLPASASKRPTYAWLPHLEGQEDHEKPKQKESTTPIRKPRGRKRKADSDSNNTVDLAVDPAITVQTAVEDTSQQHGTQISQQHQSWPPNIPNYPNTQAPVYASSYRQVATAIPSSNGELVIPADQSMHTANRHFNQHFPSESSVVVGLQ